MDVVVAEKPSVARDLARFLRATSKHDGYFEGNGYQVTWAYGHLVTLKEPHDYDPALKRWSLAPLPFVPEEFKLKVINTKLARKQFKIVKTLLRGADGIICATDAGREGELIFRYILQLSGCARKPFKRLWLSSLTSEAIRQAFDGLKAGSSFDSLFAAARARSEADWVVGLNATRSYTVRFGGRGQLWSVGRVQTPVLTMIVRRDDEIRNFKPKKFWELFTRYREVTFKHTGDRSRKQGAAEELLSKVEGHALQVKRVSTRPQTLLPPQLFDLTELQRHMNRRASLSAAATLKAAQRLYEAKLITYPRTDSRYLSSDMRAQVPKALSALQPVKPDEIGRLNLQRLRFSRRIVNDAKISDHHAIIPTGKTPSGLSTGDARVFDAVLTRFIAAFYPNCEKLNTTVDAESNRVPFRARGSQVLEPGWTLLYPRSQKSGTREEDGSDQTLPPFSAGESGPHEPFIKEGVTKPPSYFNDSSLLTAMETCGKTVEEEELREALKEKGLGTPATRAQIIETLIGRDYICRRGKQLTATDSGRYLVALVTSGNLKSPELTGEWEGKLRQVEAGRLSHDEFMAGIVTFTREVIESGTPARLDASRLGPCPLCGRDTIQGKRAYGCSGWRDGCTFVLVPEFKRAQLTVTHVRELLQCRRLSSPIPIIDEGGMRHILLTLNSDGELEDIPLPVPSARKGTARKQSGGASGRRGRRWTSRSAYPGKKTASPASPADAGEGETIGQCPLCGQTVIETPKAFSCSGWQSGCKFAIWKRIARKAISQRMASTLLVKGETSKLKGFKSKAGKPFSARLKLDQGRVKLDFS